MQSILLTIDVEDWFQVENLRPWFPPSGWDHQQLRIEKNTRRLLDMFDSFDFPVRATFFTLGWIAERCRELVHEIADNGHEVASHGYSHLLCAQMSRKHLVEDLAKSKCMLEDIIGAEVTGYRAPCFSIDNHILDLIEKAGYAYDSSYNSFSMHGRYGKISNNGYRKSGIALQLKSSLFELPVSNLEVAGKIMPWGGGGYFRFCPSRLFRAGIQRILNKTGAYVFYLHPWEIDPDQPRVKAYGKMGSNLWRHYINLDKTFTRLQNLIKKFNNCNFITCRDYINRVSQKSDLKIVRLRKT